MKVLWRIAFDWYPHTFLTLADFVSTNLNNQVYIGVFCYSRSEKEASVMQMFNLAKQFPDNIVRFYGCVQWNDGTGLVMEYLPNKDLSSLIFNADVELGAFLRLRMCTEIANGLALIHNPSRALKINRVMVHGDVKAENVLLTANLHCKIADFGSSQLLSSAGLTTTSFPQGTIGNEFTLTYAAPELLKDITVTRTPSTDTYSFGMIVYLVLSRKYPFTNDFESRELYLLKVKSGQLFDPVCDEALKAECEHWHSALAREPVDLLKTVMEQCQKFQPSKRPNMKDVANLLKADFKTHEDAAAAEEVVALQNIGIKQPQKHNSVCQSIDKFKPPFFQNCLKGMSVISLFMLASNQSNANHF